jgi:hypothetical protein
MYDSNQPMTRTLPNDIIQLLKKLTNIEQLLYRYANVMQQIDNSSCGLFIIGLSKVGHLFLLEACNKDHGPNCSILMQTMVVFNVGPNSKGCL